MKIKQVIDYLELMAPVSYAESFDNVGLLTGSYDDSVRGVLIALDCIESVVDDAIDKGCNLIVTFHPIIFGGLKSLVPNDYVSRTIVKAIKNDIAIYAIHTALDNARYNVSHRMADVLGLQQVRTLIPKNDVIKKLITYVPVSHFEQVRDALFATGAGNLGDYSECSYSIDGVGTFKGSAASNPFIGKPSQLSVVDEKRLSVTFLSHLQPQVLKTLHEYHPYEQVAYELSTLDNDYQHIGMGAIGVLPEPMLINDFLTMVQDCFNTGVIRYSKPNKSTVSKVAMLGGSGVFAISNAIKSGADAYLTADLKYHDFFNTDRLLLCDIGHYESEQFTKKIIYEYLIKKFSSFAILCTDVQTNPVNYF